MYRKRKRLAPILTLVLIIASILALSGCQRTIFVPDRQGSKVMTIDYEDITKTVVTTYDSYNEFASSEYANMQLNDSQFKARNSYYSRAFFKTKRLIVAKFNDLANACYMIDDISVKGNEYSVTISQLVDGTKKNSVRSLACFLEVPTESNVKGAIVNITMNRREATPAKIGDSLSTSDKPLIASAIVSDTDLDEYKTKANKKTKEMLKSFDSTFFGNKYLIAIDTYCYDDTVLCAQYDMDDQTLNIDTYSTTHYRKKADKPARQIRFVEMPKGRIVRKIVLNAHSESDFNVKEQPQRYELELTGALFPRDNAE